MLRLWRDSLRIVLAPDRLVLVRASRWRRRISERSEVPVAAADGPAWAAAVAALRRALDGGPWRECDVHVVLSDRLVRYLLVPASAPGAAARVDGRVVAEHYFREAYGDLVSGWTCALDDTPGADGLRLAVAVDRDLVNAVTGCFGGDAFRLQTVVPAMIVAFNHFRREWTGTAQWFAVTERDGACLCLYQDGGWREIRNIAVSDDLAGEMARVIARESVLAGLECKAGEVAVLDLDALDLAALEVQMRGVRRLAPRVAGKLRGESPRVALAMAV